MPVLFGIFFKFIGLKTKKLNTKSEYNWIRKCFHMFIGSFIIFVIITFEDRTKKKCGLFLGVLYLLLIHIIRKSSKYLNGLYLKVFRFMLRE